MIAAFDQYESSSVNFGGAAPYILYAIIPIPAENETRNVNLF